MEETIQLPRSDIVSHTATVQTIKTEEDAQNEIQKHKKMNGKHWLAHNFHQQFD